MWGSAYQEVANGETEFLKVVPPRCVQTIPKNAAVGIFPIVPYKMLMSSYRVVEEFVHAIYFYDCHIIL